MKIEKSCPLPQTHNRLRQAHEAWHEAMGAYPDADEFCMRLNALIPALRSVTFVLQKEARHFEGFEPWYAEQQEAMKADPILRWLVDARNHIEKQGDLVTRSTARAQVLAGAMHFSDAEFEVPPLASPAEIASEIEVHLRGEPTGLQRASHCAQHWY